MIDSLQFRPAKDQKNNSDTFIKLSGLTVLGSFLGIALWQWLVHNRDLLPDPKSPSGKALSGQYIGTLYDTFLVIFAGACIFLAIRIVKAKHSQLLINPRPGKYIGTRFASFVKNNPIVTVIFAVYTVVLVQEATWFHGELVGWIQEVFRDNLLNNFSVRYDFVSETLRRTDYRLFPLSHQDLHIYSWFTPYIKVMILMSAVQLMAIVICGKRFAEQISQGDRSEVLLLISTVLILFSASIAYAFFQLDFAERMVTFLLAMYSLTYLHYLQHRDIASCYITFSLAMIGIYWKDTAFILFIFPAIFVIACNFLPFPNNLGKVSVQGLNPLKDWQSFYEQFRLELWLLWLLSAFCLSYIFMALLPSAYLSSKAYGSTNELNQFAPLLKFWILIILASIRFWAVFIGKKSLDFLDALNVSAMLYVLALYILVGYRGYSYQYAPIEFVIVVNILCFWIFVSSRISRRTQNQLFIDIVGFSSALFLIGFEHLDKRFSFYGHASRVHELHNSWEEAYKEIDELTRQLKKENNEVNIIYTSESWFSKSRHLDRLRYDRLIEWNYREKVFKVRDGIGEKSSYKPQLGDIYINIDRDERILPAIPGYEYKKVYQFAHKNSGRVNGQIYSVSPAK